MAGLDVLHKFFWQQSGEESLVQEWGINQFVVYADRQGKDSYGSGYERQGFVLLFLQGSRLPQSPTLRTGPEVGSTSQTCCWKARMQAT